MVTRDSLHYRKLTDKPRAKEEDSKDSDKMKDVAKDKSREKDPAAGEALAALAFGVYSSCVSSVLWLIYKFNS
jgi:glutamate synthase domain-containing protein 1